MTHVEGRQSDESLLARHQHVSATHANPPGVPEGVTQGGRDPQADEVMTCPGGAFIRLGNLFNSEIYGLPTDLPWGFEFVRDKIYDPNTGELLPTVACHPTQLYEALSYILIFTLLFIFYRRRYMKVRDGFIFGVFMILLFTARFLIEFVKNDQVAFEAGMTFNMGQLLSLPFILAGFVMLYWTARKPRYFSQEPIPKAPKKGRKAS